MSYDYKLIMVLSMKELFKTIQKDSMLQVSFWLTSSLLILTIGIIALLYSNLPPYLPLYNHLPWGYERLGRSYELFILPVIVFIIGIFNILVGVKVLGKYPLLARFLFVTMLGVGICTIIFVIRLIFLFL